MVDAALGVLPAGDRLAERLGAEAGEPREYVWMGDRKDSVASGGAYYANDFLIFPDLPRHYGHLVPEITNTYRPLFLRALEALRTESAANAARWIGSLLHFTTDTGAPPHAAGISGDLHSKMENWIDGTKIRIPGYIPRLLGKTDEEAL
jgi:hypothetical protein